MDLHTGSAAIKPADHNNTVLFHERSSALSQNIRFHKSYVIWLLLSFTWNTTKVHLPDRTAADKNTDHQPEEKQATYTQLN